MSLISQTVVDRILCHCLQVKESTVADSVAIHGAGCVKEVIRACGAGRGCNSCHAKIKAMIQADGSFDADAGRSF